MSISAIGPSPYSALAGMRQAAAVQAQNVQQKSAASTQSTQPASQAKAADPDRDGDSDKGRLIDVEA